MDVAQPDENRHRFGLPQRALRFMFPQLWPEAEAEADSPNFQDQIGLLRLSIKR